MEAKTEGDLAEEELRMCERFLPEDLIHRWREDFPSSAATLDSQGAIVSRFRANGQRGECCSVLKFVSRSYPHTQTPRSAR